MMDAKLHLDISKAISICISNGVRVYPVVSGRKYKIEVDNNGVVDRYDKEISSNYLNKALSATYKHFAIMFIKEKKDANTTK
jgi:hypothetical protein